MEWGEESMTNWTPTCQPKIHKPNSYSIKEEKESMDGEFQESEFDIKVLKMKILHKGL